MDFKFITVFLCVVHIKDKLRMVISKVHVKTKFYFYVKIIFVYIYLSFQTTSAKVQGVFHVYCTSSFKLATFQVLSSHMWLWLPYWTTQLSTLRAVSTFLDWISELAHVGRWTSKKECSQELQPHCIPHSTPFAKKSSLTLQCVLGTQVPLHWESMVWATLSMENIKQNWKERLSTFISVPICLKGRNSF